MNKKAKTAKKKAAKKKATRRKPIGMEELLGLLKTHPHLVHFLIFDPKKVKRHLTSRAARRLASPSTNALMECIAEPVEGGGIACQRFTALFCRKRTN